MIGCIIQARMGSSRLPGKVMMELNNSKSLLYYVIKQHQFCNEIDKIVVATTDQKNDDIIENYVNKLGIECYRGDSNNVLDRFFQCAKKYSFPTIVRITADNPFNDPTIVDSVIKKFKSNNFDYITNSKPRTFPQGISVEVFSFKTLEIAWNNEKLPSEKEHVTPYMYNNPKNFKIHNYSSSNNLSHLRWTVDRKNDYELSKKIASNIQKLPIRMNDVLNLLKEKPELIDINSDHDMDEGYKKSLKEDQEFTI